MKTTFALTFAGLAAAQTLNIPSRSGSIVSLSSPMTISGSRDFGNAEYDRGRECDTDEDTGSESAVFILENGATLSNVIIGPNQLEGVHCKGACTLRNVWFRNVCEGRTLTNSRYSEVLADMNRRRHLRPRDRQRSHRRRWCERK